MKRHVVLAMLAVVFALGVPSPLCAHGIKIFATVEGGFVSGVAYVPGKAPLRGVAVQVFGETNGAPVTNVTTDTEGRFTLPRPPGGDLLLVVELPDGHRAEWRVPAGASTHEAGKLPDASQAGHRGVAPSSAPVTAAADARLRAIERQLHDLALQLDQDAARTRLHDILGGIGYLLGIAGIAFYLKASCDRRSGTRDRPT